MYVSDDGGENWTKFSDAVGIFDGYPHSPVLGINPQNPQIMFSQGEHGILRSQDGGNSWQPVGQSQLLNLEILDDEDRANGILVPTKQLVLEAKQFIFDPKSGETVYMVSRKGIHRTIDGGDTWVLLNVGFDKPGGVNSFAVDPLEPNRVYAGTDWGFFVSEDRGCKFSRASLPGESAKPSN